jgi:threonine dehydratase
LPAVTELVSVEDIRAAAQRLAGIVHETPLETSRAVSERVGATTLLKYEHFQRTGSFKLRGAYNRICQLKERVRSRGVVCASAGNHAQGVALSAQLLGVRARVFMPVGTPLPKVAAGSSPGSPWQSRRRARPAA